METFLSRNKNFNFFSFIINIKLKVRNYFMKNIKN